MFPLLKLPMLAVKEVFKSMEPRELMLATFLSKRTKRSVTSSFAKNELRIGFIVSDSLFIGLKRFNISTKPKPVGKNQGSLFSIGTERFCFSPADTEQEYWIMPETEITESFFTALIKHFVEAFNNPVVSFYWKGGPSEKFLKDMIQYFKNRKLKIEQVYFENRKLSAQTYAEILNACTDINLLYVISPPPPNFQYKPSKPFTTKAVYLHSNSSWINLEDFIKCEQLHIEDSTENSSKFTSESINSLLKKVHSGDSILKCMTVPMSAEDSFTNVVKGLSGRNSPEDDFVMQAKDGGKYRIFRNGTTLIMHKLE